MQKNDTVEKIRPLVYNILQDNKIELIDITYRRESGGNVLRISADTDTGITIDECARMNEVISEALDESNLIEDRYILEVASPGLDRPLKAKSDFLRVKGEKIRVHTYAPVDTFDKPASSGPLSITPSKRSASRGENKKEFTGKLEDVSDGEISISTDSGVNVNIPFDKIASARLDF